MAFTFDIRPSGREEKFEENSKLSGIPFQKYFRQYKKLLAVTHEERPAVGRQILKFWNSIVFAGVSSVIQDVVIPDEDEDAEFAEALRALISMTATRIIQLMEGRMMGDWMQMPSRTIIRRLRVWAPILLGMLCPTWNQIPRCVQLQDAAGVHLHLLKMTELLEPRQNMILPHCQHLQLHDALPDVLPVECRKLLLPRLQMLAPPKRANMGEKKVVGQNMSHTTGTREGNAEDKVER
ncbi:hypothetical protein C8J57DRAFT_1731103 [Mycena rebaudengoi]|nr:hypothetical protein C8J57DRAFT_1731103 [Mycena rebaudengoi]